MKALLVVAALFVSMPVFASEGEPGLNQNPIPATNGSTSCKDGEKITVIEPTQNDGAVRVTYTCKNGRFVETKATKIVSCNEGETIRVLEPNQNDGAEWVTYVCRDGKFVR